MDTGRLIGTSAALVAAATVIGGCGGGSSHPTSVPTQAPTTSAPPAPGGNTGDAQSPGALAAEAQQTAAGDIPDNQVFLTFRDTGAGYSFKYPEGWAQRGSGRLVNFRDKNNVVRIAVIGGGSLTRPDVIAEMNRLKASTPSLRFEAPTTVNLNGAAAVKVVYTTRSAPNAVTGKRVTLTVDRYFVPGTGKHAVIDLGTPQGVDNVDAYRLMSESFRWR